MEGLLLTNKECTALLPYFTPPGFIGWTLSQVARSGACLDPGGDANFPPDAGPSGRRGLFFFLLFII